MTTRTLSRRTRYLFSALKVDGRTATTAVTNFNFNNLSVFFLCFFSSSSYVFPPYPEKKFPYLDDYAYRIKFAPDSVKSKFDDFNPPRRVSNIQQELDNCYYKGNCIESSSELRRYRLVTMFLQGTEIDTQEELFDFYIKLLANAMGIGETEAMRKIYLVSCGEFYGFGAEFDRVAFRNLLCRNGVTNIVPDTYYHARKMVPNVQSALQFTPLNRYLRLENIFSYYHLSEPNSKRNSDHWLITIKHVGGREVSEFCVKMLAAIVGSEKAALEKIYIIWFESPFGFGAEIDEATSNKLRGLADVLTVLPDYAFDIKAKIGFNPDPLNVFCYSYGLRVRYFRMSEEYDSRDWLISKEEQVVVFGDSTYSHALQSVPQFTPINRDHILNNIFSYHHFSKGNPEWNSDHWLIHIKRPDNEFPTEQETVDICIQLLAKILGSEKEAKKKIYVVWCKMPFGFGAEIDEESSIKLKDLSNVLVVLPDYAFDVKNRNRGVLVISASSYLEPGNPRVKRFPLLVPEFVDDFADSEDS